MSATSGHKDTESLQTTRKESAIRKIIHVDMDAFYASVEQRDDPALRGRPVIVGGQPDGRGVVAACSYEARVFGVHSAMPSAEAARRCPAAVFVKPRFSVYQQVSAQIQAVFREFTDLIEPLSLDEAYLDVTASPLFEGSAVKLAREIKALILQRTQLIASAGVSYNKFLAKIASDHDKPDGLYCIVPEQGETFVASLPIGRIHGVGKVTEARMHDLGILTGADLRLWSEEELSREFGKSGQYLYRVARGIDDRPVRTNRRRKSMGAERTFGQNMQRTAEMLDVLTGLAKALLQELAEKELDAATITIKVRFADFTTFTRAYTAPKGFIDESCIPHVLPLLLQRAFLAERAVLQQYAEHRMPQLAVTRKGVRLLGVSFRGLKRRDRSAPSQLEMDW